MWYVDPEPPLVASRVRLFYNRKATNLAGHDVKPEHKLNLRWGVNGWKGVKTVAMERKVRRVALVFVVGERE